VIPARFENASARIPCLMLNHRYDFTSSAKIVFIYHGPWPYHHELDEYYCTYLTRTREGCKGGDTASRLPFSYPQCFLCVGPRPPSRLSMALYTRRRTRTSVSASGDHVSVDPGLCTQGLETANDEVVLRTSSPISFDLVKLFEFRCPNRLSERGQWPNLNLSCWSR